MKISIRTKFTLGIVFFFVIIAVLSVLSVIQLNSLSKKTSALLKENYFSMCYAREMSEALTNINAEITRSYVLKKPADSVLINTSFGLFKKSLQFEKKIITEEGEDKLVLTIESEYKSYRDSAQILMSLAKPGNNILYMQKMFLELNQQFMLLSQMNGKAMEIKTNIAKASVKKALLQMTFLATLCFLVAFSFTYSFSAYFNERFFQLHNGIKEIVSSNYGQRLHFEGKDEFYEIALLFNQMAEKLDKNFQNVPFRIKEDIERGTVLNEIGELERTLAQMKIIENQAKEMILKIKSSQKNS